MKLTHLLKNQTKIKKKITKLPLKNIFKRRKKQFTKKKLSNKIIA